MRHILGMAKRFLDLNGAKGPKLELDYLRLTYVVKELRTPGVEAQGYLLVMTPEICRVTSLWKNKYRAAGTVHVLVASPSDSERLLIEREVASNTAGMLAGSSGSESGVRSSAMVGAAIAERYLAEMIGIREPTVSRITRQREFPFGIRWDYYGVAEAANQGLNRTAPLRGTAG